MAALSPGGTVGLIANPASGHDLRRLVSGASISTNVEKVNAVRRLFAGLGAVGVERVLVMPDASGLTLGIERAVEHHRPDRDGPWPMIEVLSLEVRQTIEDTRAATSAMASAGVGAIVVLGGDGTARAVASRLGETPLLALSTGTNNAFGAMIDGTVAGMAAGLVATGRCSVGEGCRRAKQLRVTSAGRVEIALVDVAVVEADGVGARAVWHPSALRELVVTFAEPGAIGLSAIAAAVAPCGRDESTGRLLTFGPAVGEGRGSSGNEVLVPLAPGLVRRVHVEHSSVVRPGRPVQLASTTGVVAVDGERELLIAGEPPTVVLEPGPLVIDVPAVLDLAAARGWWAVRPERVAGSDDGSVQTTDEASSMRRA